MNLLNWDELEKACNDCKSCALCETRHKVVFGVGDKNADLMFIGEGPGEFEDKKGEPFVGRAGQFLDDMLACIDLERTMVYITNIVKCRPPNNRDPLLIEQDMCAKWLQMQIALVNPKIIVCTGRIAATALIKADFKITREHGQWFDIDGRKYIAIFHPSALLRDPTKRPETFVDLKNIQKALREN